MKQQNSIVFYFKRMILGIGASYFNVIISLLNTLITIPLYLRYLGKDEYGIWLTVLGLVSYLGFSNLGIGDTMINMVTGAYARKDVKRINTIISTTFFSYLKIAGILLIAVWLIGGRIPWHFFIKVSPELAYSLKIVILISATVFLIQIPLKLMALTLRALNLIYKEQFIATLFVIFKLIIILCSLFYGLKLIGLVIVVGVIDCLLPLVLFTVIKRNMPEFSLSVKCNDNELFRSMIKPSFYFFVLQIAGVLVWGSPSIIIANALGVSAVVSYAITFKIISIITNFTSTIVANTRPALTSFFAVNNLDKLRKIYLNSVRLAAAIGAVAVVVLWVTGPALIKVWLGEEQYIGDLGFFVFLSLLFIQILLSPADILLMSTTKHSGYARVCILEGCLGISLSIFLVRMCGVVGVIFSVFSARLILTTWYLIYKSNLLLKLKIKHIIMVGLKPIVVPFIFSIIFFYFTINFYEDNKYFVLLKGLTGFLLFVIIYYRFSLTPGNKDLLRNKMIFLKEK